MRAFAERSQRRALLDDGRWLTAKNAKPPLKKVAAATFLTRCAASETVQLFLCLPGEYGILLGQ